MPATSAAARSGRTSSTSGSATARASRCSTRSTRCSRECRSRSRKRSRSPRSEAGLPSRGGAGGVSSPWFTLRWRDGALELLDQRALPEREDVLRLTDVEAIADAIETLAVRGAPAIGCTAAFGIACAAQAAAPDLGAQRAAIRAALDRLARTRPTAVNL